jgi:hypothetical protein
MLRVFRGSTVPARCAVRADRGARRATALALQWLRRRPSGGTRENAPLMANHASTRTTQLYDRRAEEVTLDGVERILV